MSRFAEQIPLSFSSMVLTVLGLAVLGFTLLRSTPHPAAPVAPTLTQQQEVLQLTQALAQHQSQLFGQTRQLLRILGGISFVPGSDIESCNAFLARQLENFPDYDNLALLDAEGRIRCHARYLTEQAATPDTHAAPGTLALRQSGDYVTVTAWQASSTGQKQAAQAMLALSSLFRIKGAHLPDGADLTLIDRSGPIIHPDHSLTRPLPAWQENQLALPVEQTEPFTGPDGVTRLYARQPVEGAGSRLSLLVGLPLAQPADLPQPGNTLHALMGLYLGGALLLLALLGLLLRRPLAGRAPAPILLASMGSWLRKRFGRAAAAPAEDHAASELRRDHEELKQAFARHEERVRQITILDQFSQFLHSCGRSGEVAGVVAQFAQDLFPHSSGALLLRTSPETIEPAASWGESAHLDSFQPDDCWALRLGKTHHVHHPATGACCAHLKYTPAEYVCIPLSAHGEMLGVLHLSGHASRHNDAAPHTSNTAPWAAKALAERSAMALSAIRREELLRNQATRDALTGLYNRRFMEETLNIEERRAIRRGSSIGLMLLDVDHFKRFNDTFGHDAGDTLLRDIGALLRDSVRDGDMPCRLGGEEFVVVLPGADLPDTWQRAESLRLAVARLAPEHEGKALGNVTVSIGVASYPQHGDSWQAVLKAADLALYEGKRNGRNRVIEAK